MFEIATGRQLDNEEAPTNDTLEEWLESHPGWQAFPRPEEKKKDFQSDSEYVGQSVLSINILLTLLCFKIIFYQIYKMFICIFICTFANTY